MSSSFDANDMIKGTTISKAQAAELEEALELEPENLSKRLQLLSYYSLRVGYAAATKVRFKHIDWLIKNHPDMEMMFGPMTMFSRNFDVEGYAALSQSWLAQIEAHPTNAKVIGNAASFFQLDDRNLAQELFLKAQALEPCNSHWSEQLGNLHKMNVVAGGDQASASPGLALEQFENALNLAPDQQHRFYALTTLVEAAAAAGAGARVQEVADELIPMAENYRNDWNYGNAIFHANYALAKIALDRQDYVSAAKHFVDASNTRGSPQLDSFGPKYELAAELMRAGQTDAVRQYVTNCAKFWKMDMDLSQNWLEQIDRGEIPNFSKFDPKSFSIRKLGRMLFKTKGRSKKEAKPIDE